MAPSDYACYIYVNNNTDVDLILNDSTVSFGEWPKDQPPNTIYANTQGKIILKDRLGRTSGSEGTVVYELYLPDHPDLKMTFNLYFTCPWAPWSDNHLTVQTNFSRYISVVPGPAQPNGHPFTGSVDVRATGNKGFTSVEGKQQLQELSNELKMIQQERRGNNYAGAAKVHRKAADTMHAEFDIGFDFGGGVTIKRPVHESITIAAGIASRLYFPPGLVYRNIDKIQWEWFRGLIWNDDPACKLFNDQQNDNKDFDSTGASWSADFYTGPKSCIIQRSHFGDLQFLHSMATKSGEKAADTKAKIMRWLEVMYKLSCGNQGITEKTALKEKLSEYFNTSTSPSGDASFRDLFLATTPSYRRVEVGKRALGSCLHLIEDSYAIGHTHRRLKNSGDQMSREGEGYIRFRPNTYGQYGDIIAFHTYKGQSDRHKHYDGLAGGDIDNLSPKRPETFNAINGARDAIAACTMLFNFWQAKTKWEDGVEAWFSDKVFALDSQSHDADTDVDNVLLANSMVKGARSRQSEESGDDSVLEWKEKNVVGGVAKQGSRSAVVSFFKSLSCL